jgi:Multiubiquitin
MNVVTLTADGEHAKAGSKFKVQIGDADFVFAEIHFADAEVTGARICTAAGRHPIEDYVVLKHLESGELETLHPSETSKLDEHGVNRFFVVNGAETHRFFVDDLAMEWSHRKLVAWQIKFLAGAGEEMALTLERRGAVEVFDDDDEVFIGGEEVERFHLRRRERTVTVIYGSDVEFVLERRIYTAEELMTVFGVPAGYKLDIIGADGSFRELEPGERIRVKNGMEFASHPPVGQSS